MTLSHHRAKDLFLAALDRPAAERAAFVADACGSDEALKRDVESLLAFHDAGNDQPSDAVASFTPGEVFAGRYRMITRIGRGGMGDVWRADDLILQTPVALKIIHGAGEDARARILNEVRLARQITHPAVCRVFDVGEAENGGIFYTMELIQGADLATLLRRVGRMPPERVVDIGRQLCGGLEAAHAQNVLHRDLKPANILVDDSGVVRITDFGIAITRRDADRHMLTGTPAYMAPEQRTQGSVLSERTDVYALGVMLYELLVGRHPYDRSHPEEQPPLPSTLVRNVPPQLERVIMEALSPNPLDRPASAGEMAEQLADVDGRPKTGTAAAVVQARRLPDRWGLAVGIVGTVIGVVAIASTWFFSTASRSFTAQDTIVLADVQNATGDPVFDGALKVALAVALEQSPFLKVMADDRARDTLRLMERSPDEPITRALAREIAQRERLKALLAGSIASLGRNYVLTLEAINADTGDVMAREQAEARSKEEVLTALGAAISRLREKLGESLASIQRFDTPLPLATTASLEALHAYAQAFPQGTAVPRLEAIPHLKRAIDIDPTFAMAHAQLSSVYTNTGQSALAPEFSRTAFELRDRVSERERFFISWRYYRDATQDADKALDLARAWTATYPREAFAFNALGAVLIRVGRFEESIAPLREAIRLDDKFSPSYSNLAAALFATNRFDDARQALDDARQLDFNGVRRLSYLLAFVQGDTETMTRELEASLGVGETNSAYGWHAHTLGFAGRAADAHDEFRRGVQASLQGGFQEVAAQLMVEDAETHAIVRECDVVPAEVAMGLGWSRDNGTLERASRALALCGHASEAQSLAGELGSRYPEATLTNRVELPIIAAIIALERGDANRVLELLEPARPYDHAPSSAFWTDYLRGTAYLLLKDPQAAAAQFQIILERRGEAPVSMLYPLASLGMARAAALGTDAAATRTAYERFLSEWQHADPDSVPVREARAEYARVQNSVVPAGERPRGTR